MINWQYYPKSDSTPEFLMKVIRLFEKREDSITSAKRKLKSDRVLEKIRPGLKKLGFRVEKGKKTEEKIRVPVLFGRNGQLEKYFEADAWHEDFKVILEIEAGRGYTNYQFLKDLFQACMMHDTAYLVIAIRNTYGRSRDFEKVIAFFETLYASGRMKLPLRGVLIIGY